jgi:hypothetical protein
MLLKPDAGLPLISPMPFPCSPSPFPDLEKTMIMEGAIVDDSRAFVVSFAR